MARSVNIYTETNTLKDSETGEVVSHQSNVVNLKPRLIEPPFVKMYVNDICNLVQIKSDAQKSLLLALLRKLDYDGYITISRRFKDQMCKEFDIKDQTLKNRIGLLLKTDVLKRTGTSEFMVNPDYFAMGSWEDICANKLNFEMVVKYNTNGKRTIKTAVIEDEFQQQLPLED
jgi:hypothetical protein